MALTEMLQGVTVQLRWFTTIEDYQYCFSFKDPAYETHPVQHPPDGAEACPGAFFCFDGKNHTTILAEGGKVVWQQ
jgi:hypothetical protein